MTQHLISLPLYWQLVLLNAIAAGIAVLVIPDKISQAIQKRWDYIGGSRQKPPGISIVSILRYGLRIRQINSEHYGDASIRKLLRRYWLFWAYFYISIGGFLLWTITDMV